MTRFEEAWMLEKISTSKITRTTQRVSDWLPRELHFHDGKTFVKVTNARVYKYEPHRPLMSTLLAASHTAYNKWCSEVIKEIACFCDHGNVAIMGSIKDDFKEAFKLLKDFVEYKPEIFK